MRTPEGKTNLYLLADVSEAYPSYQDAGTPQIQAVSYRRMVTLTGGSQCQYGRDFQKTTHIFTNDLSWEARRRCPGKEKCHHSRNIKSLATGFKTSLGLTGNLSYYERALIPEPLCEEILIHNEKQNDSRNS